MAFQSVPDTAQINVIFDVNGEILQNSFYALHPGGYSLANLQALADDIDTAIPVTWQPRQAADCIYLRTDVLGLDQENDLVATQNANTGPGGDITAPMPNNVTFALKKLSGLTGRSARGRSYWIGIPKDKTHSASENRLDATYITNILSAIDSIRTNIDTTGLWEAVLVSRFTAGAKRSFGVTFPWVGTTFVNDVIDTQRGRLPA